MSTLTLIRNDDGENDGRRRLLADLNAIIAAKAAGCPGHNIMMPVGDDYAPDLDYCGGECQEEPWGGPDCG